MQKCSTLISIYNGTRNVCMRAGVHACWSACLPACPPVCACMCLSDYTSHNLGEAPPNLVGLHLGLDPPSEHLLLIEICFLWTIIVLAPLWGYILISQFWEELH